MASDPNGGDKAGQDYIDVTSDVAVHEWAKHFGVSPMTLIEVVNAVGPRPEDVARHLRQ
jgi:hypothetical protein